MNQKYLSFSCASTSSIIKEYGNKEQFESTSLESLNKENHEEKEENAEDNSQMQQDSNEEDKEKEEEVEVFEAFFNYMIVTAHNDSTIRFWNENVIIFCFSFSVNFSFLK